MLYKVIRNLTVPEGHFKEGTIIESRFFQPSQLKCWEKDGVIQYHGESADQEEPLVEDDLANEDAEPANADEPTPEPKVNQVKRPVMTKGKGRK